MSNDEVRSLRQAQGRLFDSATLGSGPQGPLAGMTYERLPRPCGPRNDEGGVTGNGFQI